MRPAAIVVLALFAASAMAQINGVPASVTSQTSRSFSSGVPASVTSQTTKSFTPGVPASVTSLGPNGFGAPFGTPLPQPTTTVSCIAGGAFCAPTTFPPVDTGFRRHHHGRFGFGGFGGYVFVPYMYSEYPAYAPDGADMGAGYNYLQPSTVTMEPDPPAPTIYERRPSTRPYARDEARYDNDYRGPANDPAPKSTTIGVGEQETTTLVFADGHKMDVHNYAIVGQNLFNFDGTGPFKIPLAQLNVPATEKLNDDNGVSFKIPGT
jgi:hypothetical protein